MSTEDHRDPALPAGARADLLLVLTSSERSFQSEAVVEHV
jgi:hypothetical protein